MKNCNTPILKLLRLYILSLELSSVLTTQPQPTNFPTLMEDFPGQNKLINFIKFHSDEHVNPKTIWFLTDPTTPKVGGLALYPLEHSISAMRTYLHSTQTIPLFTGTKFGKEFRKLHINLNSFIFLIFTDLAGGSSITDFLDRLILIGNRRRDKFLFIGKREEMLLEVFKYPPIIGLKHKTGYCLEDNTILIDREVFSPGAMDKFPDTSQIKIRSPLGRNLRGRHLRFAASPIPPWLYVKSPPDAKTVEYDGSHYRIFLEASKKYNYSFELYAPPNYSYGNLLPNGTWVGSAGDIIYTEKNYDLAMVIGHFEAWYPLIDMLDGLGYANLIFVTANPQFEITWDTFLFPYQPSVWIALTCVYLAMSLTTLCFLLVMKSAKMSASAEKYTVTEQITYAFGAPFAIAMEQDVAIIPGFRTLSIIWLVAMIITGTGYKCNLASYLSLPMAAQVPSTFEELASSKGYRVYLNNLGSAEEAFFENNESPAIKAINKKLTYIPNPIECVKKAFLSPKTACVAWTPLVIAFIGQSLTLNPRLEPLTHAKVAGLPVTSSSGFQKDSIFVDSFIPIANSYFETGTFRKWEQDVFGHFKGLGRTQMLKTGKGTPEYKKLKELENAAGLGDFTPFTLRNVQFSFYVLVVGCMISALGFIIETDAWKLGWIIGIASWGVVKMRGSSVRAGYRGDAAQPRRVTIAVRELGPLGNP